MIKNILIFIHVIIIIFLSNLFGYKILLIMITLYVLHTSTSHIFENFLICTYLTSIFANTSMSKKFLF